MARPNAKRRRTRSSVQKSRTPATGRRPPSTADHPVGPSRRTPGTRRTVGHRATWVGLAAVLAVVGAMVVIFVTRGSSPSAPASASTSAMHEVTHVPASALEAAGIPGRSSLIRALPPETRAVQSAGKPVVTYVGAEYCPFCAAQRWPLVVALGRFGTFSHLGTTTSASNDVYPNTPSLSFHGSTYSSPYLVLSAVETSSNHPAALGGYTQLDQPNAQQRSLFARYDTKAYTGSDGAIPFTMIGNRYVWAGSMYDPGVLKGLSFDQIASQLGDPTSAVARTIDAAANQITAMLCTVTSGRPAEVCSTPLIQRAQAGSPGS